MSVIDILQDEMGLYQQQVDQQMLNGSYEDRDGRFNFDEVVSFGLFVIERIRDRNRVLSEAGFAANLIVMPDEESDYLVRLYKAWLATTQKLVEKIHKLNQSGVAVAKGEELLEAYRDVRLTGFDMERIKQNIRDAIEGRGKPLREAADEFRRRRYGQSA